MDQLIKVSLIQALALKNFAKVVDAEILPNRHLRQIMFFKMKRQAAVLLRRIISYQIVYQDAIIITFPIPNA